MTKPEESFTLIPGVDVQREVLAMAVLKRRLKLAITVFKTTDRAALHAARGWAEKQGVNFWNMKQALKWVEQRERELISEDLKDS